MNKEDAGPIASPVLQALPWLTHGFGLAVGDGVPGSLTAEGFTPVLMKQVHSDTVRVMTAAPAERPACDALVTAVPGLLVVVRTADCLPVLLADPGKRVVAAVHCGWRGTAARILEKTLAVMASEFGSRPEDVRAALGPAISGACYQVGADVRAAFAAADFPENIFEADPSAGPGKYRLDLVKANTLLLERAGVRSGNMMSVGACTHCGAEFYSYRRDPGEKRRLHNFIGIMPARG